jgi:hypothetical protein
MGERFTKRISTSKIFGTRHELQMFRVDACPVATEMINLMMFWDVPNKRGVGKSMAAHSDAIHLDRSVTVLACSTR